MRHGGLFCYSRRKDCSLIRAAEEIQTQELVSVTGASMRRGDKEADKLDKSGLLLESDGAYNGRSTEYSTEIRP